MRRFRRPIAVAAAAVVASGVMGSSAHAAPPAAPTITSGPAAVSNNKYGNATFTFVRSEPGGTFECALNDPFDFQPCRSPATYHVNSLTVVEGRNTFYVRQLNDEGEAGESASRSWVEDWTGPTVAPIITSAPGVTNATELTFTFTPPTGTDTVQCSPNYILEPWGPCTTSTSMLYGFIPEGDYNFAVRFVDEAGNGGAVQWRGYTVDRTPPGKPTLQMHPEPVEIANSDGMMSAQFFVLQQHPYSEWLECRLDSEPWEPCGNSRRYDVGIGDHLFEARSLDEAGNVSEPLSYRWTVQAQAEEENPRGTDPRDTNPRQPEPRQPDPRQPEPRQPDPWNPDPRGPEPRDVDPRQPTPRGPIGGSDVEPPPTPAVCAPRLLRVEPRAAMRGERVALVGDTRNGYGFGNDAGTVAFRGKKGRPMSVRVERWSNDTIVVFVPARAPFGKGVFTVSCAGKNSTASFTVSRTQNVPPVAYAVALPTAKRGFYRLDASGSYDPDGKIVGYRWSPAPRGKSFSKAAKATRKLKAGGSYRFSVVVRDNRGATDRAIVRVKVPASPKVRAPVKLTFSGDALFRFDWCQLTTAGAKRVAAMRPYLRNARSVTLEGHADAIGSHAYNDALSVCRARTVRDVLLKGSKLPASRVVVKGYGERKPRASNNTAQGRAKNRRVELTITYVKGGTR
jgi:outer membrane protein OmpA-like peptidoglycan-associated protein